MRLKERIKITTSFKEVALGFFIIEKIITFAVQIWAGTLAQLVEQRTENPCVPGSIPGGTTLLNFKPLIINMLVKGFFFSGKQNGKHINLPMAIFHSFLTYLVKLKYDG